LGNDILPGTTKQDAVSKDLLTQITLGEHKGHKELNIYRQLIVFVVLSVVNLVLPKNLAFETASYLSYYR